MECLKKICVQSCLQWVKERDDNTKKFHASVEWQRRGNSIHGVWFELQIFNFFNEKYTETPSLNVLLDG